MDHPVHTSNYLSRVSHFNDTRTRNGGRWKVRHELRRVRDWFSWLAILDNARSVCACELTHGMHYEHKWPRTCNPPLAIAECVLLSYVYTVIHACVHSLQHVDVRSERLRFHKVSQFYFHFSQLAGVGQCDSDNRNFQFSNNFPIIETDNYVSSRFFCIIPLFII